jgi:hypothetical protein
VPEATQESVVAKLLRMYCCSCINSPVLHQSNKLFNLRTMLSLVSSTLGICLP